MLDQHFMIDESLLHRIIEIADLDKSDVVLEIGGGTGNLSVLLAERVKKLVIVEKDAKLAKLLDSKFANVSSVSVICDDATRMSFPSFTKCVSNLPYTICEPLMWKFSRVDFEKLVLVVPEKFSEKLRKKGTKLNFLVEAFFEVEDLLEISPEVFDPPPKVMSSLIVVTKKKKDSLLRKFLGQYDKKVRNALREVLMSRGKTKREAYSEIDLKFRPALLNKNVLNLNVKEIGKIVKFIDGIS